MHKQIFDVGGTTMVGINQMNKSDILFQVATYRKTGYKLAELKCMTKSELLRLYYGSDAVE